MNKFFIILIIAGPAFVECLSLLMPTNSNNLPKFTAPPLSSGSFLENIAKCLKNQDFSQSIKEEISSDINTCTSTGSCTNSKIKEIVARVLCLTYKNTTVVDLIDCVGLEICFTIAKITGKCIGEFYRQCVTNLVENTFITVVKCDSLDNEFYSLVEFLLSFLDGKDYSLISLLHQILQLPTILNNCVQYLDYIKLC